MHPENTNHQGCIHASYDDKGHSTLKRYAALTGLTWRGPPVFGGGGMLSVPVPLHSDNVVSTGRAGRAWLWYIDGFVPEVLWTTVQTLLPDIIFLLLLVEYKMRCFITGLKHHPLLRNPFIAYGVVLLTSDRISIGQPRLSYCMSSLYYLLHLL